MTLISAAMTFFLVMDPLGNVPLFLTALRRTPPERRQWVILRECLIALVIMVTFLFLGKTMLDILHIENGPLQTAGGVILMLIAIRMVFPTPERPLNEPITHDEPFIVPLAVPYVAGPSLLAVEVVLVSQHPDQWPSFLGALLLAWTVTTVILYSSGIPAPRRRGAGVGRRRAPDGHDPRRARHPDDVRRHPRVLPLTMRPMLATPTATPGQPPAGPGWVHEVKWDGVRAIATVSGGTVRLASRNGADITAGYPEVAAGAAGLPDGVFDGELIAFDDQGRPSFHAIAHRMHARNPARVAQHAATRPVVFVVFDVLLLGNEKLLRLPMSQRRRALESIDLARPGWRLSDTYDDGAMLAELTRDAGLEGVISKRLDSPYLPGTRSPHWVKTPHRSELIAVIGGWIPETDSPNRLGALWVGHPADEDTFETLPVLYPLGRVGSGLPHAQRDTLLQVLRDTERDTSPFDPVPSDPEVRRTRWVEPMLCVQVRYLNVTPDGALRQPVLIALRPEVAPIDAPTTPL